MTGSMGPIRRLAAALCLCLCLILGAIPAGAEQAAATAQDITRKCQFKVTEGDRGRMTDDDVRTYWEYKKTGAYVAVALGVQKWLREGRLEEDPMIHRIAAVSVGIVNDRPMLDLCYGEDSAAQVDMNLVMDETGAFIEVQGTGEGRAFSRAELDALLSLGESGIRALMEKQRAAEGSD